MLCINGNKSGTYMSSCMVAWNSEELDILNCNLVDRQYVERIRGTLGGVDLYGYSSRGSSLCFISLDPGIGPQVCTLPTWKPLASGALSRFYFASWIYNGKKERKHHRGSGICTETASGWFLPQSNSHGPKLP